MSQELADGNKKGPSRKIAHDLRSVTLVMSTGNIQSGARIPKIALTFAGLTRFDEEQLI